MEEKLGTKIVFKHQFNLGSYFIANLAKGTNSEIEVTHKEAKVHKAFNIEIKTDGPSLFGELTAANLITTNGGKDPFFGSSLYADHWISYITGTFKQHAQAYLFEEQKDALNQMKAGIKKIEADLIPGLSTEAPGPLEILVYSYLAPF